MSETAVHPDAHGHVALAVNVNVDAHAVPVGAKVSRERLYHGLADGLERPFPKVRHGRA